jgi:hypothetical protein
MSSLLVAALAFGAFFGLLAGSVAYLRRANKLVKSNPAALDGDAPHRRQSPRRSVRKRARIVFQWGSIGCLIQNLSQSGAMLAPKDALHCPKEFMLKPFLGRERKCEVIWRKDTRLGVRFVVQGA